MGFEGECEREGGITPGSHENIVKAWHSEHLVKPREGGEGDICILYVRAARGVIDINRFAVQHNIAVSIHAPARGATLR